MALTKELKELVTSAYSSMRANSVYNTTLEDYVAGSDPKIRDAHRTLSDTLDKFTSDVSFPSDVYDTLEDIGNIWSLNYQEQRAMSKARKYFRAQAEVCQTQISYLNNYLKSNFTIGHRPLDEGVRNYSKKMKADIASRIVRLFATRLPANIYEAGINYLIRQLLE